MSRTKLLVARFVAFVFILALLMAGAWFMITRRSFPETNGRIIVPGLQERVDILRDKYGVAHIYASTPEDLFFAEGYVHAQERFWQMEFQRRVAAGRLSEIFGETTLSTDVYLRHFGFQELSEQSYLLLDAKTKKIVDAYAAGINAYISSRKPAQLGLEFALLGIQGVDIQIETWTPVDSLSWAEMMIFDQSDQLSTELTNINLLRTVGQTMYQDFHTPYRDDRPTIIASADLKVREPMRTMRSVGYTQSELQYLQEVYARIGENGSLPAYLADLGFQSQGGSNSFVISGQRTMSGKPLLANDPHMSINMPSLWYEVAMHCTQKTDACPYEMRGFSLPGEPGILIGHNDRIAWGLTNASFDAEDVFIERINPQNINQYEVNGQWVDMQIRREEIKVRGWEQPKVIYVRSTRNCVVATDSMIDQKPFSFSKNQPELYALTYAWTALQPVQSVRAELLVNKAQNWDEFVNALRFFEAGKQNWVFADVDGNIGYIMPGKVPIRAGGDGTLPVPGWNDQYRWTGFIPFDELPRVYNPQQGFIVTANNPQLRTKDYPYLISANTDRGQRAQRITDMIMNDLDKFTIQDMIAIQTDNQDVSALEIIPYLADIKFDEENLLSARYRLLKCDGQMLINSPEAVLFSEFWVRLISDTFNDQLPPDLYPRGDHETSDVVYNLLKNTQNGWWDDVSTPDRREDRDFILQKAFEEAYQEGMKRYGEDFNKWRWGNLHTITFRNATLGKSGIRLIENIFNRGPFPTNGSETVIQKTCWNVNVSFEVSCIPALRQIVDLANLENSLMIHSVGQSGHPANKFYDNFIEMWRTFQYHPSNWERASAEADPFDLLILEPSP